MSGQSDRRSAGLRRQARGQGVEIPPGTPSARCDADDLVPHPGAPIPPSAAQAEPYGQPRGGFLRARGAVRQCPSRRYAAIILGLQWPADVTQRGLRIGAEGGRRAGGSPGFRTAARDWRAPSPCLVVRASPPLPCARSPADRRKTRDSRAIGPQPIFSASSRLDPFGGGAAFHHRREGVGYQGAVFHPRGIGGEARIGQRMGDLRPRKSGRRWDRCRSRA